MSPTSSAGPPDAEAHRGPVTVLCAVVGPVEAAAVGVLAAAPDAVDLVRRCADIAELLAASAAGLGRVAVVSADLPGLDRPVVSALHADGTRVVALCPDAPWQRERMQALGVDAAAVDTEVAAQLLDLVRSVATTRATGISDRAGYLGWPAGGQAMMADAERSWDADLVPEAGTGLVVAVWGPTGAPGRSTIALNLAAELVAPPAARRRGRSSRDRGSGRAVTGHPVVDQAPAGDTGLLVDADTYSGALAQMAGLLDESSGIAAACRAAGHGALTVHQLATIAPELSPRLRILTGIARASRWPELSTASLEVVWQECRRLARWTVIDCGFALESDEMLTYDTRAPQRNAATLSALTAADVVVVVGGADAVSVQRLVRALDDLRGAGAASTAEQVVVVNRVRASAVGRQPATVLRAALLRYANLDEVHLVPDDQAACDAALLAGRTLAEVAPSSPVRRAVAELAATVRARMPERVLAGADRHGAATNGPSAAPSWSPTVAH